MKLNKFVALFFLITPLIAHADPGRALYQQHCATCHAMDGHGGVGVPLALDDFQRQVSDTFLANTIRYGRPGRVMPAFPQLSQDQIYQIVAYIRTFSDAKPAVHTDVRIKGDAQKGKTIFAQQCASCHGANGNGGKGTGVTFSRPRDLPIIAPALNNIGFLRSASDSMIKQTLMEGRDGTPMVSFYKQGMKEADINNVVAYIRQFEQQAAAKGTLEDDTSTVIEYESPYNMEETIESVKRAILGKNFRLIRVQNLDQGLVEEGKENTRQVVIYFCNFKTLNDALAVDPRVGLFLPCRITLIEQHGKVKIIAIDPRRLSKLFNNDELNKLCDEMFKAYEVILEEASL